MTYQTLSCPVNTQLEVKKSQFITYAYPVLSRDKAMFHVEQLRKQYPDARHHCWAYIIGDPHNTTSAGFDDDGEPNGTAGKPILNVLQHKSIGNVMVIVVRYFGGIKLGAGGLTRAYAGATQAVVDKMTLTPFVSMTRVTVAADFATESQVRYLINDLGGSVATVAYADCAMLTVSLPTDDIVALTERLAMHGRVLTADADFNVDGDVDVDSDGDANVNSHTITGTDTGNG